MRKMRLFIAAMAGTALAVQCLGQAGSLDPNFSADGKTTVEFPTGNTSGYATVLTTGGDLLVAGTLTFPQVPQLPQQRQIAIARLNEDGSLDNGFDGDGKVLGTFGGSYNSCEVRGMARRSDGKIVVVGNAAVASWNGINTIVGTQRFGIAQFYADGTPDTGFSSDGATTVAFNTDAECRAWDVAIQSDGKILVAGWTNVNSDEDSELNLAVVRLNENGSPDNTFSEDGKVQVDFGSYDSYAHAIAIQEDGKIVIAGTYDFNSTGDTKMVVARLSSTGILDPGFSGDGKYVLGSGSSYSDNAWDVTIDAGGRIVVVGEREPDSGLIQPIMLRLTSSGGLDYTNVYNTPQPQGGGFRAVDHQCDGKIVASGYSVDSDGDQDFLIARINTSGTLDNTFSGDGMNTTTFVFGNDVARGIVVRTSDQYITIAGSARTEDDGTAFGVARYSVETGIVPPAPTISFDPNDCELTASGSGDFDWQYAFNGFLWLPTGGNGNTLPVTGNNEYRVRVTSTAGCTSSYSATIDPGPCTIIYDCLNVPNGPALPGTSCNDNDPGTGNDTWGADCVCLGVTIDCLGAIGGPALPGTACDDGNAQTSNDNWSNNCACVGSDCAGVPNGTALPGSACDDGDANTGNDTWNSDCDCVGATIDCNGVAGGPDLPGTACDDGNPDTGNDTWIIGCTCIGGLIDCIGVTGGQALPGTACDDGNPDTGNDTWDSECNCIGSTIPDGIEENSGSVYQVTVHPNPIQDAITITYKLATNTEMGIVLEDLLGRRIATLLPRTTMPSGEQSRTLPLPVNLASGTYLLVLTSPDGRKAIRVAK